MSVFTSLAATTGKAVYTSASVGTDTTATVQTRLRTHSYSKNDIQII